MVGYVFNQVQNIMRYASEQVQNMKPSAVQRN